MKKSLIALAVAGAFAAPAFAATSNVDIYGKLHMSVNFFDDQPNNINNVGISSNASRFGLKGSEDLGGGLKGIWQIESTVMLDEQTGTLSNRNSFVGLSGGWGTALLGNHDTPLKLVGRAVDLFGDTLADSRNVLGGGSDTRAKNVVAYISPNFSGLGFAGAYSTDLDPTSPAAIVGQTGTASDEEDWSVWNVNVTYNNGPLYLGAAYGDGDGHEQLGVGSHWRLAAGFTFGNFRVVGQYDDLEDDNSMNAAAQNGDFDAWMVGASYTMGNIVLKANYMDGDFDGVGAADPSQWTVGADYNLSKRTSVYALYAAGENVTLGKGAGASDQVAGLPVAGDDDISTISLGVVHSF